MRLVFGSPTANEQAALDRSNRLTPREWNDEEKYDEEPDDSISICYRSDGTIKIQAHGNATIPVAVVQEFLQKESHANQQK